MGSSQNLSEKKEAQAALDLLNQRIAAMDKRIEKEQSIELAIGLIRIRNVQIIKSNALQSRMTFPKFDQMNYNVKILQ